MEILDQKIQERNKEIGKILMDARSRKNISVSKCANLISTSRRRYTAMERGEAIIGAAELEVLIKFLEVPAYEIWQIPRQVIVKAPPGETLQILVDTHQ